ncbi:hypothetical protein DIPPA_01071 [Diplonema papillatum]|nr:hypothetical protein DIPPA_01071 [Diplonema papillatum]|eukprot:gene18411-28394_t
MSSKQHMLNMRAKQAAESSSRSLVTRATMATSFLIEECQRLAALPKNGDGDRARVGMAERDKFIRINCFKKALAEQTTGTVRNTLAKLQMRAMGSDEYEHMKKFLVRRTQSEEEEEDKLLKAEFDAQVANEVKLALLKDESALRDKQMHVRQLEEDLATLCKSAEQLRTELESQKKLSRELYAHSFEARQEKRRRIEETVLLPGY